MDEDELAEPPLGHGAALPAHHSQQVAVDNVDSVVGQPDRRKVFWLRCHARTTFTFGLI